MPAHDTLDDLANQHKPFYEGTSAPGSPATGHYWLDTTILPYTLKRYNGSSWDVIIAPQLPTALPLYTSNYYVDPWVHGVVAGTVASGYSTQGQRTYTVPIYFAKDCQVSAITVPVSSADGGSKNAKCCIRRATAAGLPGAVIATTNTVSLGSTGLRDATFSSNQSVYKGPYWLQMVAESGASFATYYITAISTLIPFEPNTGAALAMYFTGSNYGDEFSSGAWANTSGQSTSQDCIRLGAKIV